MDYKQFVATVQEKSGLPKADSLKVIEAVLATLGERLSKKRREHLAAQLPKELKPFVLEHSTTDLCSLEVFYQRVAKRAGLSFHNSITHCGAVLEVVAQAIAAGELKDIFAELPPEFDALRGRLPEQISNTTADAHQLYSKQ
ncbi:MAG: DUF2267 domain-containing protein [Dehalococcoidia bacterium]|nr:DUF2267 domain-containing protein [Dehalococcoidia bacterium]